MTIAKKAGDTAVYSKNNMQNLFYYIRIRLQNSVAKREEEKGLGTHVHFLLLHLMPPFGPVSNKPSQTVVQPSA